MEHLLNSRIQLKYDTLENWSKTDVAGKSANLVLKSGELGIVYVPGASESNTTVLFKVGDGKTVFAELPWASVLQHLMYMIGLNRQLSLHIQQAKLFNLMMKS